MILATVHIAEDELELYCLGRATSLELAPIEEHLLECPLCVSRAQAALEYLDTLRSALRRSEASPPADPPCAP
jgi:predicted anti-sigma-YlaC factor YlaD